MKLTTVEIRNFRCIKELSVNLDETTVLIGENNSGKTAFLEAIRICLERLRGRGRGPFNEYDYHLSDEGSTPAEADPIQIKLSFAETDSAPWMDEVAQALDELVAFDDEDRRQVTLRVTSSFDHNGAGPVTDWDFLDANGNPLLGRAKTVTQLITFQRMVPAFYLSALRDASRHFIANGRFWRTFLAELGVPADEKKELEEELAVLNRRLIEAHKPLLEVRQRLEDANKVIKFGVNDIVAIDALPTKLFSLLSRTQVRLASRSGARIPVEFQGEGTQSLTVLLLFGTFLRSQLSDLDPVAEPITALEEPEAHLHPSAIRSLMGLVCDLPGQKLVSTHSGDLLASVKASAIRHFVHEDGEIKAYRIEPGTLTPEEERKFDFHVRRTRGELLFSRCWLLVEGETETTLFTGAAEALNLDLEREGVRCVEFSQTDVGMLAKVANQLGIAWFCVLDDDSGRNKYEKSVKAQLGAAAMADRIIMPYKNIELFLCENGFGELYEACLPLQRLPLSSEKGTPEYWPEVVRTLPKGSSRYSKPRVAAEVVTRMTAPDVPKPLSGILNKVIELAGAGE